MKLLLLGECFGLSLLIHSSVGGRSHIKAMLEVGQTLAERNHSVRYVALDDNLRFAKGYANITPVGLGHEGLFVNALDAFDSGCGAMLGESYLMEFYQAAVLWVVEAYRREYLPLLEHITLDRPDGMICDYFAISCHILAEANGIPLVVGMQALDWLDAFNAPYITKDIRFGPLTIEGMSLISKFIDTFVVPRYADRFWKDIISGINKERVKSKAVWMPKGALHYGFGLANSFFGFEVAQPIPPNVKVVGPILSSEVPPLDNSLNEFLNSHKRTMFVAFGSLISLQEKEIAAILKGALDAMNQGHIDGLIWGLGRTALVRFPNATRFNHDFRADPRFKLIPWAPQLSILSHPSVVVFLSHGGLESSVEAMHSRTPVLSLPIFADQARNAAKLQALGVGLYINGKNINLPTSIRQLLQRKNLGFNLDKARSLTLSHLKRREEAANYIEDHLQLALSCRPHQPYTPYGKVPPCEMSHLIPPSNRIGFLQANRLDVYLVSITLAMALSAALIFVARCIPNVTYATRKLHLKTL